MLGWAIWFIEAFGHLWAAGAAGLAVLIWFGAISLPGWLRATAQQAAVALLIFAGCTFAVHRIYADGVAAERANWEAKKRVEDDRRDAVLLDTQEQLQEWMANYEISEAGRRAALRDIEEGSHHHDAEPGLPVDSVLRLNAIRRGR